VFEPHPVDALVDRRDELDERHRRPVEDLERISEDDLRDRPAVPDVLEVRGGVSLEERAQVEVQVQSATRQARWLRAYGAMSIPRAASRSRCSAAKAL